VSVLKSRWHFPSVLFAILNATWALTFIHCRFQSTGGKLMTLQISLYTVRYLVFLYFVKYAPYWYMFQIIVTDDDFKSHTNFLYYEPVSFKLQGKYNSYTHPWRWGPRWSSKRRFFYSSDAADCSTRRFYWILPPRKLQIIYNSNNFKQSMSYTLK
jgi:hypothetical protein